MKHILIVLLFFVTISRIKAQDINQETVNRQDIANYNIALTSTVHIVSPEPIRYVDISSPNVEGDLPEKKICRIKPSKMNAGDRFIVTVVTNSFLIAYQFTCGEANAALSETLVITIDPTKGVPIMNAGYLKEEDFKRLSIQALQKQRTVFDLKSKAYDLNLWVNNIFIVGDYLMFDIGMKNKSKLAFDIDQIRFAIKDKKILKSTVSQDVELEPLFSFYDTESSSIKKQFRNFYFFKKFTYPTDKVFNLEFTEKQISGRKITLKIPYKAVLAAETF